LIRLDADAPTGFVIAHETAEQSRDVAGRRIDGGGAEVDHAGNLVFGKEDMVVPDVADDPLQRQRLVAPAERLVPESAERALDEFEGFEGGCAFHGRRSLREMVVEFSPLGGL
jgi:hypothetical protein